MLPEKQASADGTTLSHDRRRLQHAAKLVGRFDPVEYPEEPNFICQVGRIMFDKLHQLLRLEHARFRILHHAAEGSSDKVAQIRGTLPGQGAKAMLCYVKELPDIFVLAVLSGNRKVDFKKLGQSVGGKKASLVSPEDAMKITGCVIGAIPPFSFWPNVRLVVDPRLLDGHEEIAFNAGKLDTSMVLNSQDYRRIAAPLIATIEAE